MRLHRLLGVVTGAAAALALGGCTVVIQAPPVASTAATDAASPSPDAPPSTTPSPSPSESTTDATPALGPKGLGDLVLGMTKAEARASGLATGIVGTKGRCGVAGDGRLVGADPAADLDGKLFFSTNTGKLVIIAAMDDLATPEGIALGTTTAQVRAAYPRWNGYRKESYGVGYVKAPGNAKAYYRIGVRDGQVVELTLQALDQDCAE